MRLRTSSIIFGLAVVLATIVLLYEIFSLPASIQTELKKKEDVAYLESRLKRLEEDIVSNHDTIKEIKSLIKSLAHTDSISGHLDFPVHPESKLNIFNKIDQAIHKGPSSKAIFLPPLFNHSKASIHQDDCIFTQSSPSSVDIQMKDVYDLLPFDNQDGGVWKQGWNIQYEESQWSPKAKLKVFVVPHSHNDPGWIKTFETYFEEQTRHILDNMVVKLSEDHRRKFIWAEISFFALWWERQSMEVKDVVKRLVESGQFEIVTGGWVMPDEANTHYFALVDQLLTGHEWLQLNLGVKPNNGWSIDPFGMSPVNAYLLKKAGFQNMLIQRTHYSVKKHLAAEKNLEFRWRQTWDPQSSTDILCHLMPFYSYDIPHTCGPDPRICCQFDFKRLSGSGVTCPWRIAPQPISKQNVGARSQLLLDQYRKKAQLYRTNVLLVPLGDDFRYDKAAEWDTQFDNYQRLFDHMNASPDMHVQAQFGTLADYFRALRDEAGTASRTSNPEEFFPSLSGDFFSYADRGQDYWTGYFTSRPFYKRMDRILQSYLRSAEILFSVMLETETHSGWTRRQQDVTYALMDHLVQARKHLALFQHHDGVTGTSKNHVVVDYANKMLSGIRMSQHVIQQAVHCLLSQTPRVSGGGGGGEEEEEDEDEATNAYFELGEQFAEYNTIPEVVVRRVSQVSPFAVYVFNPEAHKRHQLITVRIDTPYVQVRERSGDLIPCQVDPVLSLGGAVIDGEFDLHFAATSLDALSITAFAIHAIAPRHLDPKHTMFSRVEYRHVSPLSVHKEFVASAGEGDAALVVRAGGASARFSPLGLLEHVDVGGRGANVSLAFVKYDGGSGGAYLFLPRGPAEEMNLKGCPLIVVAGPLRASLTLHHDILKHQVILRNSPGVDGVSVSLFNYVDVKSERNVELAMRLDTDVKNDDGGFYTDLNGFQMVKRVTYAKLPLQGNVYPMPTQMFIEDPARRVSLLTASPLGCSALTPGRMEVMLDRQLTHDDERGLGHGVHDNVLNLNSFTLLIEPKMESQESSLKEEIPTGYSSLTAHAALSLLLRPSIVLHSVTKKGAYATHWNLGGELPCDVELVNVRALLATRQPGAPHPPSATVALTLRRVAFSCAFPALGLACATNNGKVRLSDLFPATFSEEVKQMSLSHLYEGVDMSKSYSLTLRPMELYSFKLFISSVNK